MFFGEMEKKSKDVRSSSQQRFPDMAFYRQKKAKILRKKNISFALKGKLRVLQKYLSSFTFLQQQISQIELKYTCICV